MRLLPMFLVMPLIGAAPLPVSIQVALPAALAPDASGRLLLFIEPATPANADAAAVDVGMPGTAVISIAARDIKSFGSAREAAIDPNDFAYSTRFAQLPSGDYRLQAVLDRDRNYAYAGRGPGDLVSNVATVRIPVAPGIRIAFDHAIPPAPGQFDTAGLPPAAAAQISASRPHLHDERIASPALTHFRGAPQVVGAWVLTPPGYDPRARATYPTVFTAGGFGTDHRQDGQQLSKIWHLMETGAIPPMIWVALDYATMTGTTEFADSANNGPWGRALVDDVIPTLERRYRMDARPSGRFLTGHSSGGWFALWTMVSHPDVFGGSWSTSPDPVDFSDFLGVDLSAPGANMYRDAEGKPRPLERDGGVVRQTIEDEARQEDALARDGNGGQLRSFEWTFSPRGADGLPARLFDRRTGAVDPAVAAWWRNHYDIGHMITTRGSKLYHKLDGKVHVRVGTEDSFYLDGSVRRLATAFQQVGYRADIEFVPKASHSMAQVYARDGDRSAYWKEMTQEMYAVARPAANAAIRAHDERAPQT